MNPLIDCAELAEIRDHTLLFDIRWTLSDPAQGRSAYRSGHIPGAVFVDLDTDLAAPPGPGRHPLPNVEQFASTLGHLGVTPDGLVVVYDDMGGAIASRVWWMLRSIGHEQVRVLNGGYHQWVAQRRPIETGEVAPEPTTYPVPTRFRGVVSHEGVADRPLVDARAPERYRGDTEPVDPKAGHIPGAINLPSSDNLDQDGLFRSIEELASRYAKVKEGAIMSCGSGVTACHNALAMVLAGYEMPDVYVGSFSEWSRLDLPVHTGEIP